MPPRFLIVSDREPIPPALLGAVVAIGNFDGLHRGHRHLIEVARKEADRAGGPAAVLTFEPHPRDYLNPTEPVFRLTPEPVKIAVLAKLGLDGVIVRPFDAALAALSAEEFVSHLLVRDLGAAGVAVGQDFHFGRARQGTPARLQELCRGQGIACALVPTVSRAGQQVSSSAIREALQSGDVATANDLLGHRFFIRAVVEHGDKRGRTLGFPTANLRLSAEFRLRHGIYAVRAAVGDRIFDGVANFGRRPTFDNGPPLLEVFLFDFSGDLYGQTLDVEFVGFIRKEERFDDVDALVAKMNEDARRARALLAADGVASLFDLPDSGR